MDKFYQYAYCLEFGSNYRVKQYSSENVNSINMYTLVEPENIILINEKYAYAKHDCYGNHVYWILSNSPLKLTKAGYLQEKECLEFISLYRMQ